MPTGISEKELETILVSYLRDHQGYEEGTSSDYDKEFGPMTEEEKKTLVDAVNCKYPHQNLTEIYYNIGRALPFTAQRFPDGRVSDWYRNQYVEVVRVEPHGRGGKFGNVFGFLLP